MAQVPLCALASLSRRRCARESSARHQTKVYVEMLPPSLTSAELLDLIIDDFEWAEESVRVLFFRSGSEGTYNRKEVHSVAYLAVMGDATELIEIIAEHVFAVDGPPARDYRPRCFVAAFNRVAKRVQGSERSMVGTIDAQAVYKKWVAENAPPQPQPEAPPAAADAEEGAAADEGGEGAAAAAEASGGAAPAVAGAVANLAPLSSSSFGFGAEERILALAKETDARNAARAAQVAPLVAHLIRVQQKERLKKAAQKKKSRKRDKKGTTSKKGGAARLDAAAKRKLNSSRGTARAPGNTKKGGEKKKSKKLSKTKKKKEAKKAKAKAKAAQAGAAAQMRPSALLTRRSLVGAGGQPDTTSDAILARMLSRQLNS